MRFLIILLLITGCTTDNVVKEIIETNNEKIKVIFCPEDNCEKKLNEELTSANESIHCSFFDLDLKSVIDLLDSSKIDTKIVIDERNKEFEKDYIRYDNSKQYTHNKFCIIDNKKILTGSFNPTLRGSFYNDNNYVIIPSKKLAINYETEFNELWNGVFGTGKKTSNSKIIFNNIPIENYFCPEDNCGNEIYDELMNAEKEIYFMLFSFTHNKIANALVLQHINGIEIKGVLEKSQNSKYNKYKLLKYQNISVKWDNNKYNMHNKVFIIDNKTVITGSFNPSKNADTNNDENILIIRNKAIAYKYLTKFNQIYGIV